MKLIEIKNRMALGKQLETFSGEEKHVNMIRRFFINLFFACESTEHLAPVRIRQAC